MITKNRIIADIREEVIKRGGLPGTFLPKTETPRYDVMFLAEMPTNKISIDNDESINFNATARDKFFINSLSNYGMAGSYVTDIVKGRDIPRTPTEKEVIEWKDILLREIKGIDPKLVVVIGKRNYYKNYSPFIKKYLPVGIKDDWVFHYCSQVTRDKFTKRFVEVFEKYNNILGAI